MQILAADREGIHFGAARLTAGELVAFPTETVYGLGADATNAAAVRSVFTAKGRPSSDPLIVHVDSSAMASEVGDLGSRNGVVATLVEEFWPGPLTVVVPRSTRIGRRVQVAAEVSEGTTLGLRCPANETALELISTAGVPVAAPSANRFGRVSPTTAAHVVDELGRRVPWVIDGGPTALGIESTVVSMRGERATVLRPGAVPVEAIRAVLGEGHLEVPDHVLAQDSDDVQSPGTGVSHYAPDVAVLLADSPSTADGLEQALSEQGVTVRRVELPEPQEAARTLYSLLRELDREARGAAFDAVLVSALDPPGMGRAVNDRLLRAAHGHLEVSSAPDAVRAVLRRVRPGAPQR